MAKSLEEILSYMFRNEYLDEKDVAEIQALPTIEERVAEARERISTRRDAAKAEKGIPVGTNQALSALWPKSFFAIANNKGKPGEKGGNMVFFYQKISGLFPQENKKVLDYTLVDDAVKILAIAGRVQGLWATDPEGDRELYNATTYGNVKIIRQYLTDEDLLQVTPAAITEKMNGMQLGEICYELSWNIVGHTFGTMDNFGASAIDISSEIWEKAFEKLGIKLYRDTVYRVYGEFYSPTVQGGSVYTDHSRWYIYDVRVGNYGYNDTEHGWWSKENVGKLVAALQSLGVTNIDFAHIYSPRTVKQCIEDCKTGFPSNFCWRNGTNVASTTAPLAEGYVMDFFLGDDIAGSRYRKLKVRYDMFNHSK